MKEIWKKIVIENIETIYSISNMGKVRNDLSGRILSLNTYQGYKTIGLTINKKRKNCRVHRLVAQAFIPNPENKEYVNHRNGIRDDNRVENLEWVTQSENVKHAVDTGLRKTRSKPVRQYNLQGKWMMDFESAAEAGRQTDTQPSKITECCYCNRKSANQYQWRFVQDNIEELPPIIVKNTKKKVGQYTKENELIAIYESFREAARAVNGTESAISRICAGTPGLHTHKGYKWKIVDDIVQDE